MSGNIKDYLATDESIRQSWSGRVKDDGGSNQGTLALTDRRVAYLMGKSFKDVEYSHITSVETDVDEVSIDNAGLYFKIIGGVGIMSSFINIVLDMLINFLIVLICGSLLFAFGKLFETVDTEEHMPDPTHSISIITGDEVNQELTFETTEDIGAEISRAVREKS